MAISSLLLLILCVVFILAVWYTQRRVSRLFNHGDHISLRPVESDYQMVSMATSLTSLLPDDDDDDDAAAVAALHRSQVIVNPLSKRVQQMQSLPNSPHLRGHLQKVLSRSSTMSPRGFRQPWNGRKTPVEIELCPLNSRQSYHSSEGRLKEEKVLNTQQTTTTSQSCSTVCDPDIDLELDYYDLDVRNAGCDAPDSFLRCLADDSTYWKVQTLSLDEDSDHSTVTSQTADVPFADDDDQH